MEKYLDKLLKQFMEARGIRHANVNSEEFVNEFCSWIKENKLSVMHQIFRLNTRGVPSRLNS